MVLYFFYVILSCFNLITICKTISLFMFCLSLLLKLNIVKLKYFIWFGCVYLSMPSYYVYEMHKKFVKFQLYFSLIPNFVFVYNFLQSHFGQVKLEMTQTERKQKSYAWFFAKGIRNCSSSQSYSRSLHRYILKSENKQKFSLLFFQGKLLWAFDRDFCLGVSLSRPCL